MLINFLDPFLSLSFLDANIFSEFSIPLKVLFLIDILSIVLEKQVAILVNPRSIDKKLFLSNNILLESFSE
jgi:hypothetical protein